MCQLYSIRPTTKLYLLIPAQTITAVSSKLLPSSVIPFAMQNCQPFAFNIHFMSICALSKIQDMNIKSKWWACHFVVE